MLQFFKFTFASMLGLLLAFLIGIFIIIGIAGSAKDTPTIEDNSVLHLKLNSPITERSSENPLEDLDLPISTGAPTSLGLIEILQGIKDAKEDAKIKGIYLNSKTVGAGFAALQEIRDALIDFKKSGKFIVAYAEYYSEGAYYLASVADKIYLNPQGMMELNGLSSEVTFIKGTLEKLEVKPMIFKVGDFKSAVEPLFLDKMSDPNRAQVTSYLNSVYDFYLKNVAISRAIDLKDLTILSDSMTIRTPEDALKYKLITHLGYEDEVEDEIKKTLKLTEKQKIISVSINKYIKSQSEKTRSIAPNRVAVLVADGEIVDGKGEKGEIGTELAEELRKLRKDDKVKAIVLRINSPGGSALTSDIIWREVLLTKKVKPIIASMSNVAASGGYYIAMACDTIVAQPNTITGSIGVFGILFNAEGLLKNKIGVTTDRVSTGFYSDLGNPTHAMSETEGKIIQNSVERIYEDFTSKAAKGRRMTQDDLKKVASGRVWTGAQGKENGLVDVLGDFNTAIQIAAKKAKIEKDFSLRYYPAKKDFFQTLFNKSTETKAEISSNAIQSAMKKEMGEELYQQYQTIQKLKNMKGVQMRMPFDLNIK